MSKKLNTKTITNGDTAKTQESPGPFAELPHPPGRKDGTTVTLNGTSLADSHTAAFIQWKKNKQA